MSVQSTHYVMAGYRLPYNTFQHLQDEIGDPPKWLEAHEVSRWDKTLPEGAHTIHDGMGGKYVMVGKVLARSEREYAEFDEFLRLDVEAVEKATVEALFLTNALFEQAKMPMPSVEPKDAGIFVFTHYT